MISYTVLGEGERLDLVIWNHYQTLETATFGIVIEANAHLQDKVVLEIGDVVNLPAVDPSATPTEESAIWAS